MSKVLELTEKRAKAWEAAKAFLEAKRGENDCLSAEDNATYEKMEAEVTNLTAEIERLVRQQAIDDKLSQATSTPITNRPNAQIESDADKPFRERVGYKNAMVDALRSNFRNISNVLQEGVDADGGYLVPVYVAALDEAADM